MCMCIWLDHCRNIHNFRWILLLHYAVLFWMHRIPSIRPSVRSFVYRSHQRQLIDFAQFRWLKRKTVKFNWKSTIAVLSMQLLIHLVAFSVKIVFFSEFTSNLRHNTRSFYFIYWHWAHFAHINYNTRIFTCICDFFRLQIAIFYFMWNKMMKETYWKKNLTETCALHNYATLSHRSFVQKKRTKKIFHVTEQI